MISDERYKQLMEQVGLPNSQSLLQALKQVENEVSQPYERKQKALITGIEQAMELLNGKSIPQYKARLILDSLRTALEYIDETET